MDRHTKYTKLTYLLTIWLLCLFYSSTCWALGFSLNKSVSQIYDGTDLTVGGTGTFGGTGQSTFNSGAIINEDAGDSDTRIEGDGEENVFYVDASTNRIGVGTATPAVSMDVAGTILVDGTLSLDAAMVTAVGGTLTLGGVDGTDDEKMTIDFETTSNVIQFASTTGATRFGMSIDLRFPDDVGTQWGAGGDMKSAWETTDNDSFQLGVRVGATDDTGYVSLMEAQDMGSANRSPLIASNNPVFRVYSSDHNEALDFIQISHDAANAVISVGQGGLIISADVSTGGNAGSDLCLGADNTLCICNFCS